MISPGLREELEKELKTRITSIAPLSAANNAQIYRFVLEGGRSVVAKVAERGLDTEAYMLNYLKQKSKLPVPGIYYSNEHVIVMEPVESHYSFDAGAIKNAAEVIAAMHDIHAEQYGLERDTLIGSLRQPNLQSRDWVAFFTEHRLLYMATEALNEHKIDAKFMKLVEKLLPKLPGILKDPQPPSLIHGDIWAGNALPTRGKVAAFLDPAIYYADPEIELAFIRLFNTFDENFFKRYHELRPIRPGFFEERADIYNLYPLLVHTRLFGASYARKALRILEKFTGK
ncbi:MAG: fructosamine kinase family protein [Micavibrio sp.]|nr:fructosamine kinase family protein [Micavibrio sp.]